MTVAKRWVPVARRPPRPSDPANSEVWANDEYHVLVRQEEPQLGRDGILCLTVARNDGRPARDWRHLQSMKNEVGGPEREAIELFPAESRLIDRVNFTHLYLMPPGEVLPIGDTSGRSVASTGRLQRPWQPGLSTGAQQ